MWIYLVLALVSVAALWYLVPRKTVPKHTVLIGPSGSGKTALYQVLTGTEYPTVTSQSVTRGASAWGPLVDTPGHPKLEAAALQEIRGAQRVVFVVDATNLRGVAELLYRVLVAAQAHRVPVLVAANKYDLFSTVSIKKVQQVLEQELSEIRDAKDRGLGEQEWLGEERFALADLGVRLESGSVRANKISAWAPN